MTLDIFEGFEPLTLEEARSSSYVMTLHKDNADDHEKIKTLKKIVNDHNKGAADHQKMKISYRGRTGKDTPEAAKYRQGGEVYNKRKVHIAPWMGSGYTGPSHTRGNTDVKKADAHRFDVYLNPRHPTDSFWRSREGIDKTRHEEQKSIHAKLLKQHQDMHKPVNEEFTLEEQKNVASSVRKREIDSALSRYQASHDKLEGIHPRKKVLAAKISRLKKERASL